MTPPPHRPACVLGGHASVIAQVLRKLISDLDTLAGHASPETLHETQRVLVLLDLASDELYRLAANEQEAHPELQCGEKEREAPVGEPN